MRGGKGKKKGGKEGGEEEVGREGRKKGRKEEEEKEVQGEEEGRNHLHVFNAVGDVLGDGIVAVHLRMCEEERTGRDYPTCASGSVSRRGVKSRSGRFASTSRSM
eukprot:767885-Hanusia_phi.AAC.5